MEQQHNGVPIKLARQPSPDAALAPDVSLVRVSVSSSDTSLFDRLCTCNACRSVMEAIASSPSAGRQSDPQGGGEHRQVPAEYSGSPRSEDQQSCSSQTLAGLEHISSVQVPLSDIVPFHSLPTGKSEAIRLLATSNFQVPQSILSLGTGDAPNVAEAGGASSLSGGCEGGDA